jgi:hypothetical protein
MEATADTPRPQRLGGSAQPDVDQLEEDPTVAGSRLNRIAYSVSGKNRDRKWRLFNSLFKPRESWKVIDVGFGPAEDVDTDNYFEKHYPFPSGITALTVSDIGDAQERYPEIDIVRYDGDVIPFANHTFDLLWSNAVVEHVGDWTTQVAFLRELDRVAARHFVTTPNRWFPIEVHTRLPLLHYLPKPLFDRIATRLGKGWATGDYMHLSSRRRFEASLRAAGIRDYTIFVNRFAGFPMDFVAVW